MNSNFLLKCFAGLKTKEGVVQIRLCVGCSFHGGEGRCLIKIIRKLLKKKTVTNKEVSWE